MNFKILSMNEIYAHEIAYNWKYEGIYSFYNMTEDNKDLEEFLDPEFWDHIFAVLDDKKDLCGFFSYETKENILWIGLGLRPDLTGHGIGKEFTDACINFGLARNNCLKDYVMLSVAKFNTRAIKVYEKIGFKITEEYEQQTNGSIYPFLKMRKEVGQ